MAGLPDATFSRLLAIVKGEDAVRIPVGDSIALVDPADADRLSRHTWMSANRGYAVAIINGERVLMHRLILDAPKGVEVDHADGDGLNNQRYNLRICTRSENAKNRHSTCGQSRFKGVWRDKQAWRATIWVDRCKINLGSFTTQKKAARAYDNAARELHGAFACTNADLGLY